MSGTTAPTKPNNEPEPSKQPEPSNEPEPTKPTRGANLRGLRRAIAQLGVLQIDAVNAVARSHLLVLRPRLAGDHAATEALLARAAYSPRDRVLTEYWCHEASFCAVEHWPLYRWRMRRGEAGDTWKPLAQFARQRPQEIEEVLHTLTDVGPASATELDAATGTEATIDGRPLGQQAADQQAAGQWSQWTDTKKALGWLFWVGRIGVAERVNFTRRYDLIERVLPTNVVEWEPSAVEAQHALLLQAAKCLGVATAADLSDYHRLAKREAAVRIAELVEDGQLERVGVEGWDKEAYTLPGTRAVRRHSQSVLLSPFDPLVWFRPRCERLFDFTYRLEIYTPAAKRRYGYYVLPFLHHDRLAGRVDVRADRAARVLRVLGTFGEQDGAADTGAGNGSRGRGTSVPEVLARELVALAEWLGLTGVALDRTARGNLSAPLRDCLRSAA